jgi:uncharacterized membrane protein YphA (DoxX/SURF4 family)
MMSGGGSREALRTALAVVVGIVFVYAAALKIGDPGEFARDIKNFKLLPLWSVNAVALLLPWWELLAGGALFLPGWRRAGALIVVGLTCLFVIAVTSAMARGLDISCGCFGPGSSTAGWRTLALDVGILAAMGVVLWGPPRPEPPKSGS